MGKNYTYSESSRRPITYLALGVSLAMLALGYGYGAPWFFLAPVAFVVVMSAAMIIINRQSGMELIGSEVRFYSGNWAETIAVADIIDMQVTRWSDGAPSATLSLKTGKKFSIPGYCVGSVKALEAALAARGIATH
jgi:hypothetical protein